MSTKARIIVEFTTTKEDGSEEVTQQVFVPSEGHNLNITQQRLGKLDLDTSVPQLTDNRSLLVISGIVGKV